MIFDDDPDLLAANPALAPAALSARHRRVWTVQVVLDTVAGDPLMLLVDVGV